MLTGAGCQYWHGDYKIVLSFISVISELFRFFKCKPVFGMVVIRIQFTFRFLKVSIFFSSISIIPISRMGLKPGCPAISLFPEA